jgi:hypothetical protein
MQMQYKKLYTDNNQLLLRSCIVAERHTTRKNILNKETQEYIIVHMQVAELQYKQHIQMKKSALSYA